MAFTFGFYNSLNGDRKYNAFEMSKLFDGIILDGVFEQIGQHFAVTAGDGMSVNVGTGRAWLNHTWNENDAIMPLNLPESDLNRSRYDAVVIEVGDPNTDRTNAIKIVSGTPAVNPSKPVLNTGYGGNSSVDDETLPPYQHALAYILVPAGAEEITATNIEIVVGMDEMPFVTGPVETRSIEELFNQWDAQFSQWFANLKAQLTENVVTNLQNQIDDLESQMNTKISSLTTSVNSATSAANTANNKLTVLAGPGSIMCLANGEYGTISNYLPCTGGSYKRSSYTALYGKIGFSYGGKQASPESITLTGLSTDEDIFINNQYTITMDETTGSIYRVGLAKNSSNATTLHLQKFTKAGAFVETIDTGMSLSNANITTSTSVTNLIRFLRVRIRDDKYGFISVSTNGAAVRNEIEADCFCALNGLKNWFDLSAITNHITISPSFINNAFYYISYTRSGSANYYSYAYTLYYKKLGTSGTTFTSYNIGTTGTINTQQSNYDAHGYSVVTSIDTQYRKVFIELRWAPVGKKYTGYSETVKRVYLNTTSTSPSATTWSPNSTTVTMLDELTAGSNHASASYLNSGSGGSGWNTLYGILSGTTSYTNIRGKIYHNLSSSNDFVLDTSNNMGEQFTYHDGQLFDSNLYLYNNGCSVLNTSKIDTQWKTLSGTLNSLPLLVYTDGTYLYAVRVLSDSPDLVRLKKVDFTFDVPTIPDSTTSSEKYYVRYN